jgi:hypothetical protein
MASPFFLWWCELSPSFQAAIFKGKVDGLPKKLLLRNTVVDHDCPYLLVDVRRGK